MTQKTEELPVMDDFSESSLLDQIQTGGGETEEKIQAREKEEKEKEKEEAEGLEAKEKAEQEEEARLAKEQEENLTEEEKAELAKKQKEEDENSGSFWEDVEAITGNTYEVEYGEVEPDTPEGAAIRERVVADTAIKENLSYIEEQYPEAYQILQHVSNGGKVVDLLTPENKNYADVKLSEKNIIQQKAVLKEYYLGKGLSEAKAIRNVEDDEDSEEGLLKSAELVLKEMQDAEIKKKEEVLGNQAKRKESQDEQDKQFGDTLASIINQGKVGNFNIPKKDAESFYDHVLSQVQRSGNGYALTIPLTNDNFQEQLQQLFFGFKKGDLSKFVSTEAKSVAAKKLKRNMKKEKDGSESSSEETLRRQGKKLPTMGAFEI